jgi:hypothetical protein
MCLNGAWNTGTWHLSLVTATLHIRKLSFHPQTYDFTYCGSKGTISYVNEHYTYLSVTSRPQNPAPHHAAPHVLFSPYSSNECISVLPERDFRVWPSLWPSNRASLDYPQATGFSRQFLGTFVNVRKATVSFVRFICPSVRPSGTTLLPIDGF